MYVLWPEWDPEQLFDLRSDPTEKTNLVEDPDYAETLEKMRRRLAEWRERARGHRPGHPPPAPDRG